MNTRAPSSGRDPLARRCAGWLVLLALGWLPALAQTEGVVRWAFSTLSSSAAGNILSSPAVASDGTVYIGVEIGSGSSTTPEGRLFAIRPDGSLHWSFSTADWIDSTPAIAPDGTIYFGCWDGYLYALRSDGTLKWRFAIGTFVSASPALASDGTIYIGSGNGTLSAVTPEGTLKWSYPAADWIDSSPAINAADGTLYFGSWDNHVYALRPDGSEKWRFATGDDVVASPAIGPDGTVYVASRDQSLYALTAAGQLKWKVDYTDLLESSPVVTAAATILVATTGGRVHALQPDGTELWRFPRADQLALDALYSTPAVRSDGSILLGTSNSTVHALRSDGSLLWQTALSDWADSSPVLASEGTVYIGCTDKKLYSIYGNGLGLDSAAAWPAFRRHAPRSGRSPLITISVAPLSAAVTAGQPMTLTTAGYADGGPAVTVSWQLNGRSLLGATGATLALSAVQSANAALYAATLANSAVSRRTSPAVVGPLSNSKVLGLATEVAAGIRHPNGNLYDQTLLTGAAASITADAGQVTRLSYIDLDNDIVQVEFSGAGTVSIVLDASSGPSNPINYTQDLAYMKGHASIVVVGADETSNLSVFSVGRLTAWDPTGTYNFLLPISATNLPANNGSPLFVGHEATVYDGTADLAFVAIQSTNGRFGGIRTGNAMYFATQGLTGIYAPGVHFVGPVVVGDISAADAALPVFIVGSTADARIAGGGLLQQNGEPVHVSGLTRLQLTEGSTSHGTLLPAQTIQAQLEENGADVTALAVTASP